MNVNPKEGFIVHPFETGDNKYQASYGNHNRTVRSFNTLSEAKAYLRSKGITKALYDKPSGVVGTRTAKVKKRVVKRKPKQPRFGFF